MRTRSVAAAAAGLALTCTGLAADDRWEFNSEDDTPFTANQLVHGAVQTHDIQSVAAPMGDLDFSYVDARAGHSYEVKVFSTNMCMRVTAVGCAMLARVADDGTTVIAAAIAPNTSFHPEPGWLALRWTSSVNQLALIRVNGYENFAVGATAQYDIQMLDTTYLVPRWNSSGTQVTVLLIQNASSAPVGGSILFYNASGGLVHSQPLGIAARGVQVFSTAGIPALAGGSGSAAIVHDSSYGALAGKAVALEPSTGFTFDTLIAPIPY